MNPKITALLVMARESRLPLFEQLEGCGIEVLPVSTCQEARRALASSLSVQVVTADTALPMEAGAKCWRTSRNGHQFSLSDPDSAEEQTPCVECCMRCNELSLQPSVGGTTHHGQL